VRPLLLKSHLQGLKAAYSNSTAIPQRRDKELLFQSAMISLSYNSSYVSWRNATTNPATDITVYDLVSGLPLPTVKYILSPGGGVFEAKLEASEGSWGKGWRGGSCFALGFIMESNETITAARLTRSPRHFGAPLYAQSSSHYWSSTKCKFGSSSIRYSHPNQVESDYRLCPSF
jgi:hypothetical protein